MDSQRVASRFHDYVMCLSLWLHIRNPSILRKELPNTIFALKSDELALVDGLLELVDGLLGGLLALVDGLLAVVDGLLVLVDGLVAGLVARLLDGLLALVDGLLALVDGLVAGLVDGLLALVDGLVAGLLDGLVAGLMDGLLALVARLGHRERWLVARLVDGLHSLLWRELGFLELWSQVGFLGLGWRPGLLIRTSTASRGKNIPHASFGLKHPQLGFGQLIDRRLVARLLGLVDDLRRLGWEPGLHIKLRSATTRGKNIPHASFGLKHPLLRLGLEQDVGFVGLGWVANWGCVALLPGMERGAGLNIGTRNSAKGRKNFPHAGFGLEDNICIGVGLRKLLGVLREFPNVQRARAVTRDTSLWTVPSYSPSCTGCRTSSKPCRLCRALKSGHKSLFVIPGRIKASSAAVVNAEGCTTLSSTPSSTLSSTLSSTPSSTLSSTPSSTLSSTTSSTDETDTV
ncbi:hypothetical protein EYF80_044633 [Liparis tanakae]|uniref:Uncharacterized protein n=1 Tax=Liparis tanakae TaxID=230148 RepID=A0A4Z2FWL7_9TELE|nr:hypothetical protein EYF80_044633 [Liparis tanakae]